MITSLGIKEPWLYRDALIYDVRNVTEHFASTTVILLSTETIACEYFIDILNDSDFVLKVRELNLIP